MVLDRKAMGLDPECLHLFLYFLLKEKQMHWRKQYKNFIFDNWSMILIQ